MLNRKFSEFIKTTSISNLILVGLQAGRNVQIAISDIIKVITIQTQSAISSKADREVIEISSVDELYDRCLIPGLYGISLYSPITEFVEFFGSANISLLVSYANGDGLAGSLISQTAITPDGRIFTRSVLSDDTGDNFPLSLFSEIGEKLINIPPPIISVKTRCGDDGNPIKDVIHALVQELPAWMMALSPEITIMRRAHKSKRKPMGWSGDRPASTRYIKLTKWNDFLLRRYLDPAEGEPLKAGDNAFSFKNGENSALSIRSKSKHKLITSKMIVKELTSIDNDVRINNDTYVRIHLSSCHSGHKSVHRDYSKSRLGFHDTSMPNLYSEDWGFAVRIRNPIYISNAGAHSIFKSFRGGWPTVGGVSPYLYSPIHRVRVGAQFRMILDKDNLYLSYAEIAGGSITPL